MRKILIIPCLFFLYFTLGTLHAQSLLSTSQAFPGDILTVVVNEGDVDDEILFMLKDEKGNVCSNAPGLTFEMEGISGPNFIGLMGLSSDLDPGNYLLRAEIRNSKGLAVYERPVLIRTRDFKSEDIPLNYDMTTLRTDDSAEKRDQSRRLWALLNRRSDGAVHPVGVFLPPVKEFILTSWYGDRRNYLYTDGNTAASLHTGLDMAAATGSEIMAPLDGTVVMAEERILTGGTVVLEHLPGVYSLYYHMDRIDVKIGDSLSQGELLGTVGATGLVTGPHLHWELRVNTIPVNPERYLSHPLIDKDGILTIIDDTKEKGR
ncbi:M23 family metallopeptidase [Oceanispirochaeta crateris]|uniref:M23 family metallopeptidase n=1 Tax=Oceanispirochaeta crateris TaxID=2518645 RepID=A0A5C1QR04_9SPIO|nr:M23 family metallopeptidase [Oceanispirochaeta crateris]QEN09788.1 M23 family metallopeptidase [Oceanispirochaeta crateris]